jgi:pyruvate kinase
MERRAKIVATIGPASKDREMLRKLIAAGMDVARLNFSHGTHEDHQSVYEHLRALSEELDKPITILLDLQGPKIRIGEIEGGKVELVKGQQLTLTTEKSPGNKQVVSVDYPGLLDRLDIGSHILLDDGNLELEVVAKNAGKTDHQVETRVLVGGTLKSHKGVNLPGVELDIPALTQKDIDDLSFGLELGVDAVAVSFVRRAEDINQVREIIYQLTSRQRPQEWSSPLLIAKLERPAALDNLEAIIAAADGVMVARGDLGVEMPPEAVPIAQKRIIELANLKAKIVITATQMLESMINQPRPTRAEASDVANAIFDGTDAVMLSGETAVGRYPLEAITVMSNIVLRAEEHITRWGRWAGLPEAGVCDDDTYFMTKAAIALAQDRNVTALAAFTESGRTARMLSKGRAIVPILACTPNEDTYRRMNLYWGVKPIRVPRVASIDEMLQAVEPALLNAYPLKPGQQVVLTFGYPVQQRRPTNMAYLHTIGG